MNSIFHRAKHWQLFVLLVGGAIIFELILMVSMFDNFNDSIRSHRPPNMSHFFWVFIPMMLYLITLIFGWEWSIGWGLKDKMPRGVNMNFKRYKAFMIIPIVYILLYMIFMLVIVTRMESAITSANPFAVLQMIFPFMLGIIILMPLGLFATFCMFHNYYFCAKVLKSIELGREAELSDYIGYFFLFWFNFVGFWIIQPSVNQISAEGWIPPPTPPGYEPLVGQDSLFDPIPEKEYIPPGAKLKTKDHEAFDHDDDFEGLF